MISPLLQEIPIKVILMQKNKNGKGFLRNEQRELLPQVQIRELLLLTVWTGSPDVFL